MIPKAFCKPRARDRRADGLTGVQESLSPLEFIGRVVPFWQKQEVLLAYVVLSWLTQSERHPFVVNVCLLHGCNREPRRCWSIVQRSNLQHVKPLRLNDRKRVVILVEQGPFSSDL